MLVCFFFTGCASVGFRTSPIGIEDVLLAEAWLDHGVFHARLEHGRQHLNYAAAIEANRALDGPGRVIPMRRAKHAHEKSAASRPILLRSAVQWESLRAAIVNDLLPDDTRRGIRVSHGDLEWYLLRSDQEPGQLIVRDSHPDPSLFPVTVSMGDLSRRAFAAVERIEGTPALPLAYRTGQVAPRGLHLAVLDPSAGDAYFLQFIPPGAEPAELPALEAGLSAFNFLRVIGSSHTIGIITHPVSAPRQLTLQVMEIPFKAIRQTDVALRQIALPEREPMPLVEGAPGMDVEAFETWLDEKTGTRRHPSDAKLLIDGEAFFERLMESFETANRSIFLRIYIFDNDDVARNVADVLRRRSETVAVKILVDSLGTQFASGAEAGSAPPDERPSILRYLTHDSKVKIRRRPNYWLTGDHIKCILADQKTAWIGGMNIGREYRYDWHDMMIELRGPLVKVMARDFHKAWADAGWGGDLARWFTRPNPPEPLEATTRPVRLLYTRAGNPQIYQALREAFRRARSRIWIENAYFTDDVILTDICAARRRGVDVRVILPLRGDVGLVDRSNATAINTMLRHGVRVFIHKRMTHVKATLVDDWMTTGSANYDHYSLKVNDELNIAGSDPDLIRDMADKLFLKDMDDAVELTSPLPESLVDRVAEMLMDAW